jgi:hypothetical protein
MLHPEVELRRRWRHRLSDTLMPEQSFDMPLEKAVLFLLKLKAAEGVT